jgi:uncharacterized protein
MHPTLWGDIMAQNYQSIAFTDSVRRAQERQGVRQQYARFSAHAPSTERLGDAERAFLAQRDTFFMASVGESGWPYVQHRGGPKGFLKVLDERTVAFADFRGNRQYVSVGNLGADDRVALILLDFVRQARLKIYARARTVERDDDPDLIERLADPAYDARVERAIVLAVEAFDWNCPQHIVPRFTESEVLEMVRPLQERVEELERRLAESASNL